MANCGGSCTNTNPSSLNWFKIDEAGLLSGTLRSGFWGQTRLQQNNNSWASTVPRSLPSGNYMIRHDLLSIHTSYQPQFYPECAQLQVTGGGNGIRVRPLGSRVDTIPTTPMSELTCIKVQGRTIREL